MTMTPDKARELLEGATEGPWTSDSMTNVWSQAPGRHGKVAELHRRPQAPGYNKIPQEEVNANSALIAAAPDLAKAYIDAMERVEEITQKNSNLFDLAAEEHARADAAEAALASSNDALKEAVGVIERLYGWMGNVDGYYIDYSYNEDSDAASEFLAKHKEPSHG